MQQQRRRSGIILGLMALGLLAGVALTAPPAQAVEAPGPYYAEPAWDQQIAPANRFVVLTNWGSKAVLDKETGLVWERTPSSPNNLLWNQAMNRCLGLTTGNRKGWRLPSMDELASLVDHTQVGPALPVGHPFTIVLPIVKVHWTATTNAATDGQAWYLNLHDGSMDNNGLKLNGKGNAWCVRGGNNAARY